MNLIATRADANIKEMTDETHPIIKDFAEKWGCEFMVLDHETDCNVGDGKYHYRIMKFYDLLDKYDRILHIDSDVVLNKTCPNPFEEIPEDSIGTVFEDRGSRQDHRRKMIRMVQKRWGDVGWETGYINTGFFMVSKCHKDIFQKVNGEYWTDVFGFDDVHLGYQICKLNMNVYELDYKWNHMSMFSEKWNGDPSRFDSYVLHYAGKNDDNRIKKIRRAVGRIYG